MKIRTADTGAAEYPFIITLPRGTGYITNTSEKCTSWQVNRADEHLPAFGVYVSEARGADGGEEEWVLIVRGEASEIKEQSLNPDNLRAAVQSLADYLLVKLHAPWVLISFDNQQWTREVVEDSADEPVAAGATG